MTEVCNFVPVNKGDVFFIDAGTLHAIGEGILIAEVQQNSNTTYRVSDYGRRDANGNLRELHIDKALDVTKTERPTIPYGQVGETTVNGEDTCRELARCDLFTSNIISLKNNFKIETNESFASLIVLEGAACFKWADNEFTIKKGDSVFIPAGFEVELEGKAEILYSYI